MHQPDNKPRHSLYYQYEVFPAAPRPAAPARVPVLVVGAGPVGLTLALDLARQGLQVLLVESQQQVCEGSRAIVFTRRTLEILQQVGADRALTRQGLPWRFGSSFFRDRTVFRLEAPKSEDDRFFPMTNLQQQYLEEALLAQVRAQPLIELRWGHALTAITRNTAAGVEVTLDTPEGPYSQAADWLVACDGARSSVRRLMGLEMSGTAYEGRFVIADIRADLPFPTERRAYFDPGWNPGNTVLMHRQPQGIWRIDYQLPAGETPEQALDPASLMTRIDAQLAMVGAAGTKWQLDWCSVYSARTLTLDSYVHQRVCFAGDAAHLLPIFGVRGANTGLQDGQNLAWKLAATQQRVGGPGLMASYSEERVAAAREIIDEAGKSTRFMTPPTRGFRLLRDATLSLALTQAFVRPLFHWRTSRPHDYRHSRLNAVGDDDALFSGGPAAGSVMANVRLAPDQYLMDDARPGFVLLHFGRFEPGRELQDTLRLWRGRGLALRIWAVSHEGDAAALPGAAEAVLPPGVDAALAPAQSAAGPALSAAAAQLAAEASPAAGRQAAGAADQLEDDQLVAQALGGREAPSASWPIDRLITRGAERVWQHYGVEAAGAAYLLRPDQHVAARWVTLDGQRLHAALTRALGRA